MSSEISKLNINGTTYDIKDVTARKAAADAVASHEALLNKTTEDKQTVNGEVQFKKGVLLSNGASITDNGQTVTFI